MQQHQYTNDYVHFLIEQVEALKNRIKELEARIQDEQNKRHVLEISKKDRIIVHPSMAL